MASELLLLDNGPQLSCSEFQEFTRKWDIEHVTSSPRYAQSNGQEPVLWIVAGYANLLQLFWKGCGHHQEPRKKGNRWWRRYPVGAIEFQEHHPGRLQCVSGTTDIRPPLQNTSTDPAYWNLNSPSMSLATGPPTKMGSVHNTTERHIAWHQLLVPCNDKREQVQLLYKLS